MQKMKRFLKRVLANKSGRGLHRVRLRHALIHIRDRLLRNTS
jgi:hypothetical protein